MSQSPKGQDAAAEDSAGEDRADEAKGPSWRGTAEEFDFLRRSFRSSYKEGAAEAPTREEVAAALRTLAGVISQMMAGAGNTLKDPAVKQQVQKTTRSVIFALAGVFSDWVSVVRSRVEKRARGRRDSVNQEEAQETAASEDDSLSDQAQQDS